MKLNPETEAAIVKVAGDFANKITDDQIQRVEFYNKTHQMSGLKNLNIKEELINNFQECFTRISGFVEVQTNGS
jgi:hypothetical protein